MIKLALAEEILGYQTVTDPSNTDKRLLIAGSQNVLITQQLKVQSRPGYTRLGVANAAMTPVRNGWRWDTSTGTKLSQRFYSTVLEVYLTTVDGTTINAWTQISAAFSSTAKLRPALSQGVTGGGWYDSTEAIDLQLMVQADASIYEWNGAVAIVSSTSAAVGSIAALNATPTNAGTGYVVGDVLTITSDGTGATATVTSIGASGAITGVVIALRGSGYSTGTGKTTSGGTGTSATLNITTVGTGKITKTGTSSFAQNRFYQMRNKTVFCVRTGVEYTYTDNASTLEIVGMGDPTALVAGDILIQKIVTNAGPTTTRKNYTIYSFQNQIVLGSEVDELVYISKNANFADFTYSSPRIAGEGGLLTLDDPTRAISSLGTYLLVFAGRSSIFRADYQQITVSTTLAETIQVKKFDVGVNQGALNQECTISIGNQIAYLTNEVSLRTIDNVQNLTGISPTTLSNPIKPDFDAETWDPNNSFGAWYKSTLFFSAGATSHLWMLNYIENSNGKTQRYWNPPQILPAGPLFTVDLGDSAGPLLYAGSNAVAETYLLFDGLSDAQYPNMDPVDKIAIHAIAQFAYDHNGARDVYKNFDEYAVDGEINPNTKDLLLSILYDFDGYTQIVQEYIDGTDETILEGNVNNNSVAQSLLAQQPLGGLLNPPADARRFRVIFEEAKEDYFELSVRFETNDVDRYWGILAHGPNATLSRRRSTTIRK